MSINCLIAIPLALHAGLLLSTTVTYCERTCARHSRTRVCATQWKTNSSLTSVGHWDTDIYTEYRGSNLTPVGRSAVGVSWQQVCRKGDWRVSPKPILDSRLSAVSFGILVVAKQLFTTNTFTKKDQNNGEFRSKRSFVFDK